VCESGRERDGRILVERIEQRSEDAHGGTVTQTDVTIEERKGQKAC
jgi:hypothetical protein